MYKKTVIQPNKNIWDKIFSKISCYNLTKVIDPKVTDPEIIKPKVSKKKKSIPLTLKRKVWNIHIGENIGKSVCLCCKLTEITQLSFSCGHIISEFNGGEIKLDNLKPICVSCNSSMGKTNMDDFIKKFGL